MKKWLSRLTKIAFFVLAFMAVVITVLFNMGGNNETLHGAIEDYIGQSTGFAAQIQNFNKMSFFPNVSVDMEGILLKRPNIKMMEEWAKAESEKPSEEQGKAPPPINYRSPDATIGAFKIAIGFWDVGFGSSRKIKNIQIDDAHFNAGSIAHKAVHLDSLSIDETAEGKPFLHIKGKWGEDTVTVALDLQAFGSGKGRKYFLGEEGRFAAEIGAITMQGILRPRTMGGLHIRDLKVFHQGHDILKATFSLVRSQDGMIDLKGDFTIPQNGSNGTFDWQINSAKNMMITGNIETEAINPNDFNASSNFSRGWRAWDDIFKDPAKPANDNHDISVTSKDYNGTPFNGKALIKDNQIIFQAQ